MITGRQKSARDLAIGDVTALGKVSKVDTATSPGVVYVWMNGSDTTAASVVFNHGDPVTVIDQEGKQ